MDINIVLIISATLIFLTTIFYLEEHSLSAIGIDRMNKKSFDYHSFVVLIIALVIIYMSNPLISKFVSMSYASLNTKDFVLNPFL